MMKQTRGSCKLVGAASAMLGVLVCGLSLGGEAAKAPFKVTVQDEKAVVVAAAEGPVDPTVRIKYQPSGNMYMSIQNEAGQTMHLSHFPTLLIDGQPGLIGQGQGQMQVTNGKLPKTPSGKERNGYMNVCVLNEIKVTQSLEVIATKSPGPGQKRRMDALLIRHTIENLSKTPKKVGLRIYMDAYIIDNDGALFAAPTMPGKVLNGVELKDKTLPDFVQILQRPDLKNPGFIGHFTINLGSNYDKANRVVLTHHGNNIGGWDMAPNPSQGDSAFGVFWDPKEIKPGGKRETAYTYGQGVGIGPESEGRFSLQLGGNMEPGKVFTIAAHVNDPAPGQTLALELPKGMERVEGREIQPVPEMLEDRPQTIVLWKARVVEPGQFAVRVRSSTGLTQSKLVDISLGN